MDMDLGLSLDVARAHTDMTELQSSTGCSGASCDDILKEYIGHPLWYCSGQTAVGEGGNFKGHVFPGTLFLIWATHWMVGAMIRYFSLRSENKAWQARSTEQVLWFKNLPLESILKVSLPPIAMMLELWLAHPGGYRLLVCGSGEVRAGHFVGNHLNNWAHATMYVGFIVSGFVELVGTRVALPNGVNHIFLGLGFAAESVLMGLHKKHSPLDIIVHVLLFLGMLLSAVFCMLEAAYPHNFLFSCGRFAAVYLQGFWFIGTAHIMYKGLEIWSPAKGDLSPTLYTPIVFLIHCISILFILLCGYIVSYIIFAIRGTGAGRGPGSRGAAGSHGDRSASAVRISAARSTSDTENRYLTLGEGEGLPVSTNSKH